MKKTILTLLTALFATFSLWAQNNNLKRNVLFTLGANEKVYDNEYFLAQQLQQNRFACIIEDTQKDTYTFVFNGKRIITTDGNVFECHWNNLSYLNIAEEKGYVFYYRNEDGYYVNYKGATEGAFDNVHLCTDLQCFNTSEKDGDYYYKLAGKWYVHKDGKNKKINFIEDYQNSYGYGVNINCSTSQAYDEVGCLHITKNGKYAYFYKNNGKWYANINGKTSNAYYDFGAITLAESGKYAYSYKNNGKEYVNINDEISQGYDGVYNLQLTESGKYAYSYKNNGKKYVNINGEISQGYDNVYNLRLTESGKYAYSYKNYYGKEYVNINGEISQGYDNVYNLTLADNGVYAFKYEIGDGRIYQNNNGKSKMESLKMYNYRNIEFYSADNEHSFSSNYEYEYVVIDGRRYGKSPALQAWYNESNNSFGWNSIEGKELVVYEYKLD